jgi:hypothetical protein
LKMPRGKGRKHTIQDGLSLGSEGGSGGESYNTVEARFKGGAVSVSAEACQRCTSIQSVGDWSTCGLTL